MKKYIVNANTQENEEVSLNEMVENAVNAVIAEAVSHFNTLKKKVRDPEEDARYFYNDNELTEFLKQIVYPDTIWVSTVKNNDGSFFAYRIGRVVTTKKGVKKV